MDDLAALLDDRPERDRRSTAGPRLGRLRADLFAELAAGDGEEILLEAVGFALRDRPVAFVSPGEERPTRVGEEDLDLRRARDRRPTEQQDPGALTNDHPAIVSSRRPGRPAMHLQPLPAAWPVGA